jgi:hypothetical protein
MKDTQATRVKRMNALLDWPRMTQQKLSLLFDCSRSYVAHMLSVPPRRPVSDYIEGKMTEIESGVSMVKYRRLK